MSNYIYVVPESEKIHDLMSAKLKTNYQAQSIDVFFDIDSIMLLGYMNSIDDLTYAMPLGFRTYAPEGADMLLLPRSSSGNPLKLPPVIDDPPYLDNLKAQRIEVFENSSLQLANTIGYIDWDYRNEWKGMLRSSKDIVVTGEKAYLQAIPVEPSQFKFKLVSSIDEVPKYLRDTTRGEKGFGSSG